MTREEAIEKIKTWDFLDNDEKEILETLIPELRESENERIRKAQLDYWRSVGGKEWHGVPVQETIAWLEKQGNEKKYTFKSLPRLLDMIEPTSKAKAYCQKLMDTLVKEGYATDAKIVGECLKQMNGEKIPLATMDEKQGEQEQDPCEHCNDKCLNCHNFPCVDKRKFERGKSAMEAIKEENVDNANKVEPKFKVGDFIKHDKANIICKVISVNSGSYYVENIETRGRIELFNAEQNFHLWTIVDAKDGDVLVASDESLFIFAKVKDNSAYYHFSLCTNGSKEISNGNHGWETAKSCYPATEEQRNLLFQEMSKAGYEWDKEKKELKRLEKRRSIDWLKQQKLG